MNVMIEPSKRKQNLKVVLWCLTFTSLFSIHIFNQASCDYLPQCKTSSNLDFARGFSVKASPTRQPRILLGIFCTDSIRADKLLGNLICFTYLKFYSVHQTDTPKRVCSLQDFVKRNLTIQNDECQVVYTFVFGGNPEGQDDL
jgi:hypothetical protein